jgi:hypothetical protein
MYITSSFEIKIIQLDTNLKCYIRQQQTLILSPYNVMTFTYRFFLVNKYDQKPSDLI